MVSIEDPEVSVRETPPPPIGSRRRASWWWVPGTSIPIFGGLLMLVALYFVGGEQGAVSIFSGMYVHEFVHDARHLLGFPCH